MSTVKICYRNILESGTTTLVGVAQNDSYPLYRTYDRDIDKLFKFNAAATGAYIHVDQGSTIYAVDRLIIPAGHNFNSYTLSLKYSDDNINFYDAVSSWVQGNALQIEKTFSSISHRYWKFIVESNLAAEMTEVYLTPTYTFERNVRINLTEQHKRNVYREEALSGKVRLVKNGLERRGRKYSVLASAAQRTSLESWNTVYDGTKMFYVVDHTGTTIFMEMLNDLEFEYVSNDYSNVTFDLLEVL